MIINIQKSKFIIPCSLFKSIFTILIFMLSLFYCKAGFTQNRTNARAIALGGAYSAIAKGFYCVGYNPANLALPSEYRSYFNIAGLNFVGTNNFVSLKSNAKYSGRDLTANGGKLQEEFLNEIPENGWRTNFSLGVPMPLLNFSINNKAFTSDIIYLSDYYLSSDAMKILFGGVEKGIEYDLSLRYDAMAVAQYSYSMAIPYDNFAVGFSLKYLQGFAYCGLDPRYSSGTVEVDTADFVLRGSGEYHFRQAYGGKGFGVDIGIASNEFNGWQLSASLINILGAMKWNVDNLASNLVGSSILEFMGDGIKKRNPHINLDFEGESYSYAFRIDSVSGERFLQGDSGYSSFFFSEGDTLDDPSSFKTPTPALLRLGLAKQIRPDLLIALEFAAAFQKRLQASGNWRFSIGTEYTLFPVTPLRLGFSFGGLTGWEINLGSGINAGFLHLDWAVGFHQGIWIHTAKGFNFALDAYITRKGKDTKK